MKQLKEELRQILKRYRGQASPLISILQEVQQKYHYLPEEALEYIAAALNIPPALVWGVATFYAQFSLKPKGKYVIRVCNGTACHVRGSEQVHMALCRELGLKEGQDTTPDLQFTVETVSCLGACGLAPVVVVNDQKVYGQMTTREVTKLLEALKEEGEEGRRGENIA